MRGCVCVCVHYSVCLHSRRRRMYMPTKPGCTTPSLQPQPHPPRSPSAPFDHAPPAPCDPAALPPCASPSSSPSPPPSPPGKPCTTFLNAPFSPIRPCPCTLFAVCCTVCCGSTPPLTSCARQAPIAACSTRPALSLIERHTATV
ncbi:hypothetical protein COCSADRAFT_225024 [Bipolaris sorokiniana ND90Pr]|uniref:Uncharacterized protein n=1 Tax=Cochliobolus sativus (strain ND90Pr / ATCC 201652) TaxID=665912 RepID=M2SYH5_COCSN|nr:uncharacterized protein COCSADRAFT_225024 [Bipolaris sorokiniana ND90Pr]EMD61857.1 hypothetical protein COCSADRAFT_225024 [Bipolaris sorokiniana ND90Pr]